MSRFITIQMDNISARERDLSRAKHISRAVAIAGNHGLYHANCLKQSLLLWWLLARRGINTEIKFGAQEESGITFGAHAWVEYDGEALGDLSDLQHQFLVS